jgi:hypothetical protein
MIGTHWRLRGAARWHTLSHIMMMPLKCPVCGNLSIEPVLEEVKVTAEYESFAGDIGGLKVYRCMDLGHIFFVRITDLNDAQDTLVS